MSEEAMDLISNLTEPIIHHIMSFLPQEDLIRISAVSKRFASAWRTFPTLDFNYMLLFENSIPPLRLSERLFLNFLCNSLKRRDKSFPLQRLHLEFSSCFQSHINRVLDEVISLAIEDNVKMLELDFGNMAYKYKSGSTDNLSFNKSIRVLKAKNVVFSYRDLILTTNVMEEIRLTRCDKLKTIEVKSRSLKVLKLKECYEFRNIEIQSKSLEVLEVKSCYGLEWIHILDAPNLKSFVYGGIDQTCDLIFPNCKSLKNIWLKESTIDDDSLKFYLSQCLMLENLNLEICKNLRKIEVSNPNLTILNITNYDNLNEVQILSRNLQSLKYRAYGYHRCEVNIHGIQNCLKDLTIHGVTSITSRWIEDILWRARSLEYLKLESCDLLGSICFIHQQIKSVELSHCSQLVDIHIVAPELLSFKLWEPNPFSSRKLIISNKSLQVHLSWSRNMIDFMGLRKFSASFDRSGHLTLDCSSVEDFIIPEKFISYPIYDLKHLKIQQQRISENFAEMVTSLLLLALLPETMSFSFVSHSSVISIKFQYGSSKPVEEQKEEEWNSCCEYREKCWRHYLSVVELNNFGNIVHKQILIDFIIRMAVRLQTIYLDSEIVYASEFEE